MHKLSGYLKIWTLFATHILLTAYFPFLLFSFLHWIRTPRSYNKNRIKRISASYLSWGWTSPCQIRFGSQTSLNRKKSEWIGKSMDFEQDNRACIFPLEYAGTLADSCTALSSPKSFLYARICFFQRECCRSNEERSGKRCSQIYLLALAKATPRAIEPWSAEASAVSSHHIGITSCLYYMQSSGNVKCFCQKTFKILNNFQH